jgi:hypothetical protein
MLGCDGVRDHIPALDGKDLEEGIEAVGRRGKKLRSGIAEQLCAEDRKDERINGESRNDEKGGPEGAHGSPDDVLYIGDELEKKKEFEGPDEPEDEQELGVVNGGENLKKGRQAEHDNHKIEDVPLVSEKLPRAFMPHLDDHFSCEKSSEKIIGTFEPGIVAQPSECQQEDDKTVDPDGGENDLFVSENATSHKTKIRKVGE